MKLSEKELNILRFIRRSRHKTTVAEIAGALRYSPDEVRVFLEGMVGQELLNLVRGGTPSQDSYYTNPEKREEIFALIG